MENIPKILFHGNCQSMAFAKAISKNSGINVTATPNLWEISEEKVKIIREFARDADLIFSMPVSDKYKPGLGTNELIKISKCPFIIHSNAHFEGCYPTFDFCRDSQGKQIPIGNMGNPTGGYLCYLTYALFYLGHDQESMGKIFNRETYIDTVPELYQKHIQNFSDRESMFSKEYEITHKSYFSPMWDLLNDRKSNSANFSTFNHPSTQLLSTMIHRIIGKARECCSNNLGWLEEIKIDESNLSIDSIVLPIYPFVAKSLGCDVRSRVGISYTHESKVFTQEELIEKYCSFFKSLVPEHEAAIQSNGKFSLAIQIAEKLVDADA